MCRYRLLLPLMAVLLSGSVVWAQVDSGVQTVPPATEWPPPSAPPGQQAWPPPPPAAQPAPPPVPSAPPPAVQAGPATTPWVMVPGQPEWQPAPSPWLGLIPGADSPHWDVSFEALWLERDTGAGVHLGYTGYNFDAHAPQARPTHNLWSDDVLLPLEPGIRFQLIGRISDRMTIEASGWGLQQWSIGRTIYGDPAGETVLGHSPWLQTSELAGGFDNSLGYTYSSEVANAEINQRFKLFAFDPYRALSWLWGVRYFHLSEDFTLSGSDLYTGDYENLNWQTQNNLIGMQLGLQSAWGWDRFQLSTEIKAGLFANVYTQHGTDSANGTSGFQPFDVSHGGTDLAAIVELSLLARYRLTNCLWLRAGYQYYCATGLALGPRQLGGYDTGGTVQLDGLSVGLELIR
jgi:hypothetical protein